MKHVIVTTKYRGTYFGELSDRTGDECVLKNARMAIRWGTTNGVDQLASTGPTGRGKYGALAPSILLFGITHITDCTDVSVEAWHALDQ